MTRVALVTGSTRGLGRTIAERLARDGCAVAVNGLPGDAHAEDTVCSITSAGGVARPFAGDVTDEAAVAGLVAAIESPDGGPRSRHLPPRAPRRHARDHRIT